MAKRQVSLFSFMSAPKPKRGRESEEGLSVSEEVTFDVTNDPSFSELEDLRVDDENEVGISETALDTIPGGCSSQRCANEEQSFQVSVKNRNCQSSWYKQYPCLSVCLQRKVVFCLYCRYAVKHNWLTFSIMGFF